MSIPEIYIVFDVESAGLHGEGFAVGAVAIDSEGNELQAIRFACPPNAARGTAGGHEWCKANLPEIEVTHTAPLYVRNAFWRFWRSWADKKAKLVADCGWPVEARFLCACVDDNLIEREWQGPYPLYELASFVLANRGDPLKARERLAGESPVHDPLADARQSARLLLESLKTFHDAIAP